MIRGFLFAVESGRNEKIRYGFSERKEGGVQFASCLVMVFGFHLVCSGYRTMAMQVDE